MLGWLSRCHWWSKTFFRLEDFSACRAYRAAQARFLVTDLGKEILGEKTTVWKVQATVRTLSVERELCRNLTGTICSLIPGV